MEAKIGAKKILMKKAKPVVIAVIPVRPPSARGTVNTPGSARMFGNRQADLRYQSIGTHPVSKDRWAGWKHELTADSMYAVTGETPIREPIEMLNASTQYATVLRSKSSVLSFSTPANLAIE
jgi:hypothetical protein